MPRKQTTADLNEQTLSVLVNCGELPALLMTTAHLTGDMSVLRDEWRPASAAGSAPTLSDDRQAAARLMVHSLLNTWLSNGRPSPARPSYDTLHEIATWALGKDATDLVPMIDEEFVLAGEDPRAPRWSVRQLERDIQLRIVVIGAGLSGLLAGYRLQQAGVPFIIYEKNSDVGGTWLENRYPGCRVDTPSPLYSYSFAPGSDWSEDFGSQALLLEYFRAFARREGLYEHIYFGMEARSAHWDETNFRWRLNLKGPDGCRDVEAEVVVAAMGQLNKPSWPDIPGRHLFAGPSFHTAEWNAKVSIVGKCVGVVGTGASACQLVPHLAGHAGSVVVFMRTPPWLMPMRGHHGALGGGITWISSRLPTYVAWHRLWLFLQGLNGLRDVCSVDPGHPPTEHGVSAANEAFRDDLIRAMDEQIVDHPELRQHVMPQYPPAAKRVVRDDGRWITALKRQDVTLVTSTIQEISADGITTVDGVSHKLDVLVYATGFKAASFLDPVQVIGREGQALHDFWGARPRAYLGSTVPGFPNLFMLYGPNTNLVVHGASVVHFSECQVAYLIDAIRLLLQNGKRSLEVRRNVFDHYNARVDRENAARAWCWSEVKSWFNDGCGGSSQNWPFSLLEFWQRTRTICAADYDFL